MPPPPPSPTWQVLLLVSPLVDPKTLAVASCVSRSWNSAMSSDHLWRPHCLSHFPSAFLHLSAIGGNHSPSPQRLFSLLSSSAHRRRHHPSPRISLHHLLFAVDVFHADTPVLSITRHRDEIVEAEHGGGVFCFEFEVDAETVVLGWEAVRVKWTVVMDGWSAAVTLMDRVGKGRVIGGTGMWFSEELPGPSCCSQGAGYGGVVAEMGMELDGVAAGDGKTVIRKVSLCLLRSVGCRYMGLVDALLYLQPFLLHL